MNAQQQWEYKLHFNPADLTVKGNKNTALVLANDFKNSQRQYAEIANKTNDVVSKAVKDSFNSLIGGKAKVVISDASPSLCGIKNIDQLRSIDLTNTVIGIADNILEPKGNLVMKVFQGPEYKDMLTRLKKKYRQVKTTKPPSSRKKSSEMYVVGLDFKPKKNKKSKD